MLKTEIKMKEGQIRDLKREFGLLVFEHMEKSDQSESARVFNESKAKIDAINAEIAAKKLEIQELTGGGST